MSRPEDRRVPPFVELSPEDMDRTQAKAADGLARQRAGLSDGVDIGNNNSDGPLLGPKETSTVTQGVPWGPMNTSSVGGNKSDKKGLVCLPSGNWGVLCEQDNCSWHTEELPIEQIQVLVTLYGMHVSQEHEKKEDKENEDKDQATYLEVTKIRKIEAHEDNRVDILSPVRFDVIPLRAEYIAAQQPAVQTPIYGRRNVEHFGLILNDLTIISKLHNRAWTGAKLKYFASTNLGTEESEKAMILKLSSKGDFDHRKNYKGLRNMSDAVDALLNADLLWGLIHPCDYGTKVIVHFLIRRINHPDKSRKITSVVVVERFFEAAMKGNIVLI